MKVSLNARSAPPGGLPFDALVATGMGLATAASKLGISRETARTHLARCFDRTGARSQAALVRLIAGMPPGSARS